MYLHVPLSSVSQCVMKILRFNFRLAVLVLIAIDEVEWIRFYTAIVINDIEKKKCDLASTNISIVNYVLHQRFAHDHNELFVPRTSRRARGFSIEWNSCIAVNC